MPKGGKREGAGRKPGARGQIQIDGQHEALKWGPAAIRKAAHMAGLLDEKGDLIKELGGKGGEASGKAESESVRKSALDTIIERAYGKAPQPLQHGDNEGGPLAPTVNVFGTTGFGTGGAKPPVPSKAGAGVRNSGD